MVGGDDRRSLGRHVSMTRGAEPEPSPQKDRRERPHERVELRCDSRSARVGVSASPRPEPTVRGIRGGGQRSAACSGRSSTRMSLWVSVSDTTRAWPGLRSCFQARAIRSAETSCATATMSSAGTPRRRSSVTRWSGGDSSARGTPHSRRWSRMGRGRRRRARSPASGRAARAPPTCGGEPVRSRAQSACERSVLPRAARGGGGHASAGGSSERRRRPACARA